MTLKVQMRQGDTSPVLSATLVTSDGLPIDLTGCTVAYVMRSATTGSLVVDHQAAVVDDPAAGSVHYAWQSGDTAVTDTCYGGFVVTDGGGHKRSVPSGPPAILVVINPTL